MNLRTQTFKRYHNNINNIYGFIFPSPSKLLEKIQMKLQMWANLDAPVGIQMRFFSKRGCVITQFRTAVSGTLPDSRQRQCQSAEIKKKID